MKLTGIHMTTSKWRHMLDDEMGPNQFLQLTAERYDFIMVCLRGRNVFLVNLYLLCLIDRTTEFGLLGNEFAADISTNLDQIRRSSHARKERGR